MKFKERTGFGSRPGAFKMNIPEPLNRQTQLILELRHIKSDLWIEKITDQNVGLL